MFSINFQKIDIQFKDMTMDFQNLGFLASVFQSVANSASNVVSSKNFIQGWEKICFFLKIFDSIKPLMLKDAYVKIKTTVDDSLADALGDAQIPNSISPVDYAIAECRKMVRAKK